MRLIDADELKLSFCRECTLYPDKCLEETGDECDWHVIWHINMMKSIQTNSDLISRKAAIDRVCEFGTDMERCGKTMMTMVDVKYLFINILESLPSAIYGGNKDE